MEQERTLLNKDTYNASKAIYRVGPDLPVALPVVPDVTALWIHLRQRQRR